MASLVRLFAAGIVFITSSPSSTSTAAAESIPENVSAVCLYGCYCYIKLHGVL